MNADDTGAERRGDWIKTNRGVACCVAGVAVALLVYLGFSEWAFRELRDGFRLGFFTAIAVLAMLICALSMIFDRHRFETDDELSQSRWMDWAIAAIAMALCYVYFELAWRIDFLLITPVFMAGATYILGVRPLRSAITSGVVITVVIYGLFRLIGIELPSRVILVTYSGTGKAMNDFLGGHINMVTVTTSTAITSTGRASIVVNASSLDYPKKAKKVLGNVPNAKTLGLTPFNPPRFIAMHPNTPDAQVAAMSEKLGKMLKSKPVTRLTGKLGEMIVYQPHDQAAASYRKVLTDAKKYLPLFK